MQYLLDILADAVAPAGQAASVAKSVPFWDVFSVGFSMVGLVILAIWLFRFGGFSTLTTASVRRNRMPPFLPLILVGSWLLLMAVLSALIQSIFGTAAQFDSQIWTYVTTGLLETGLIFIMLFLAHHFFARRLRGFGLEMRTLGRDTGIAAVNLLGTYPFIILALWGVLTLGRLVNGDFDIQRHQSLTLLAENGNSFLAIVTIFFAVLIAPVFEELLFRGFLQSGFRSAGANGWTAIIVTSIFFAFIHFPNYTHMPSLFFLSCGMGYAYERGGSLFRPILMHVLFNGLNVLSTLLASSAS